MRRNNVFFQRSQRAYPADEAFLHDNTVNQYEQQSAAGVSLETHKSVTTVALMVPSSEIEGVFRLGFQLNA